MSDHYVVRARGPSLRAVADWPHVRPDRHRWYSLIATTTIQAAQKHQARLRDDGWDEVRIRNSSDRAVRRKNITILKNEPALDKRGEHHGDDQ